MQTRTWPSTYPRLLLENHKEFDTVHVQVQVYCRSPSPGDGRASEIIDPCFSPSSSSRSTLHLALDCHQHVAVRSSLPVAVLSYFLRLMVCHSYFRFPALALPLSSVRCFFPLSPGNPQEPPPGHNSKARIRLSSASLSVQLSEPYKAMLQIRLLIRNLFRYRLMSLLFHTSTSWWMAFLAMANSDVLHNCLLSSQGILGILNCCPSTVDDCWTSCDIAIVAVFEVHICHL